MSVSSVELPKGFIAARASPEILSKINVQRDVEPAASKSTLLKCENKNVTFSSIAEAPMRRAAVANVSPAARRIVKDESRSEPSIHRLTLVSAPKNIANPETERFVGNEMLTGSLRLQLSSWKEALLAHGTLLQFCAAVAVVKRRRLKR